MAEGSPQAHAWVMMRKCRFFPCPGLRVPHCSLSCPGPTKTYTNLSSDVPRSASEHIFGKTPGEYNSAMSFTSYARGLLELAHLQFCSNPYLQSCGVTGMWIPTLPALRNASSAAVWCFTAETVEQRRFLQTCDEDTAQAS